MFRNRKSAQKPAKELYAAFKQTFPHVGPGTSASSTAPANSPTSLCVTSMDQSMDLRNFSDQECTRKDNGSGLGEADQWRLSPSMLDTSSFAFASFTNHHTSDFGSTPGCISTVFHNTAGDLHTPGMGFQLGTPLSISTSEAQRNPASAMGTHAFPSHLLQSQPFQNPSPFTPQPTYAPSSFVHQDSGYETIEPPYDCLPADKSNIDMEPREELPSVRSSARSFEIEQGRSVPPTEKFRYQVTLNAPTAMTKDSDEIPITYLNKGQAYLVSISDSMGLGPAPGPVKYRTVIRISFEDEQQRQRPSACWQLWKEGRGLAEAHQRGGKLQAVEYVDSNQGGDEERKRPRVELEMASFDCFSVTWAPSPGLSTADCSVAVRFNFLSTDFSHSKGVKGIPVRLCAKTEIISSGTPDSPPGPISEVCFCKVKLFRDHGAERKLSNDVAHIKKTIEKLNQQITQVENGAKDVGKRKRSCGDKVNSQRPSKVQKHKRTWSISSQESTGRPAAEEDLHMKLATMQDMFTSTRPVSVLYLRGYEDDDPDAYPVSLPRQATDTTNIVSTDRKASWDHKTLSESTLTNSCVVSPSPSSRSMPSDLRPGEPSSFRRPAPFDPNQQLLEQWEQFTHFDASNTNFSTIPTPAVRILKSQNDNAMPKWIDALEVDSAYKAPAGRLNKPVACFYVLINMAGGVDNDYYRAIYLMERTVKDLIASIATKCGVAPTTVTRITRINPNGLKIMVDDEVVREISEGQDMTVEFAEVDSSGGFKQEPSPGALTPAPIPPKAALEMRLSF